MNIIPFAVMAGGWLAPLITFWFYVWGPLRPFDYPPGDLFPNPLVFMAGVVLSIGVWWMPSGYFRVRRFERTRRVYEMLGVKWFRQLVPDGDLAIRWRRRSQPFYRVVGSRRSAAAFVRRTKDSERGHLVFFMAGLLTSLFAANIGWTGWSTYIFVGNIIVNVYPILLQRYTRARLASLGIEYDRPLA